MQELISYVSRQNTCRFQKCEVESSKMDRGYVGLYGPTDNAAFDIYNLFVL